VAHGRRAHREHRPHGQGHERRPRRLDGGMEALPRRRGLRLPRRRLRLDRAAVARAGGLRDTGADHLGEGPPRPEPRRLPLAARAMLVRRARGRQGPPHRRPHADDALVDSRPRRRGPRARHAEAGRVHGAAGAQPPGRHGLRALRGKRHHRHRLRAHGPHLHRDGARPRLLRCRRAALGGVHRQESRARPGGGRAA
jgi:hypothetical protein